MQEELLQRIWEHSLYQPGNLHTTTGEPVQVLRPGVRNRDAGPDFSHARIQIGATTLAGAVELHIRSSDWRRHGHSADAAYRSVVLHVVYEDDAPGVAGTVPVLELKPAIAPDVLVRAARLLESPDRLPCAEQHHRVPEIIKKAWLARLLTERWETRFADWRGRLEQLQGDWQGLFYERLCVAMGFKLNAEGFGQLARSLPLKVLLRHHENLFVLEALLFGQSGLLPAAPQDAYPQKLAQEYRFWQQKYSLQPLPAHVWKFLRTRPANFPTVRLAQLAALVHHLGGDLLRLLHTETAAEAVQKLQVPVSDYWRAHSRFETPETGRIRHARLGKGAAEVLALNALAPVRYLMAIASGNETDREGALRFPEWLPAEDNHILRVFVRAGWLPENAAESQALLTLFQQYCSRRRCLECAVGLRILRAAPAEG